MTFLSIILGIALLLLLITVLKLDAFISFILVCLFVGIAEGLSVTETVKAIQTGIGNTMGSLVIILGFGAMLGKLVAESGAANEITNSLVAKFGLKNIQIALIVTGFIVGIPMFYTVGFVILVPLVIAIAAKTKLPLLYIGLPMLASLSVTHGFLPPHPAPTAIGQMFGADLGRTLIYGIIVGIPAIFAAKFLLAGTMQKIQPKLLKEYIVEQDNRYKIPSLRTGLLVALLPVLLIGGSSLLKAVFPSSRIIELLGNSKPVLFLVSLLEAIGNPAIAMLLSVLVGIVFLGIRTGRPTKEVMKILSSAISGVAVVMLIISGAGAFKQVMIETNISGRLGDSLSSLGMSPIILAWLIAAIIRVSVGSATVAGMTAAGIMLPMVGTSGVAPELLVLATGAGSIFFSHVNDGGFWLFKEYFNVTIKETLMSWTLMETIVSVVGLLGILLLNMVVS